MFQAQEASISDLPSIARPRYSNGPSPNNPPRLSIVGGYVIDNVTCIAWGSRIMKEPLNPDVENDSLGALCIIMQKIEGKPYRARFIMFGPESYKQYMVVTQSAPFYGWKGMDPESIPKFEEGEREAAVRQLLDRKGITQYEFRTELY